MSGIGHNNGPAMDAGRSWRKHVWTKARADLLPRLPIEIIRLRVARARDLGLDYRTYASVRASTGRDVVGFLFSSNALRMLKSVEIPPPHRGRLAALRNCARIAVVHPPLSAAAVGETHKALLEGAIRAPSFAAGWGALHDIMARAVQMADAPANGVLLVGDTSIEREWSMAGRLAGYLTAERYFGEAMTHEQ